MEVAPLRRAPSRRVVVCGPEASGTSLLTRIVGSMSDVTTTHRSIPDGEDWMWFAHEEYAAAIVVVRDFYPAARAKVAGGHVPTLEQAYEELRWAIRVIGGLRCRWTLVTYEALVARPAEVVAEIAEFLGVDPPASFEPIRDENEKWYELRSGDAGSRPRS